MLFGRWRDGRAHVFGPGLPLPKVPVEENCRYLRLPRPDGIKSKAFHESGERWKSNAPRSIVLHKYSKLAVTIGSMPPSSLFDETDDLAEELMAVIDVPLFDDSPWIKTSDVACSLSLEHWASARALLRCELLSSAIVVHRAQFEAIARSVWLLYAASEDHVSKMDATLSLESEQAAKNMPQVNEMMQALATKAPAQVYDALSRFKENSWKALNSYAHAGIHPIRRHGDGYPVKLAHDVLRNANGLAVVSCMQAAALSGRQSLQREILAAAKKRPCCMPPSL